MFKVKRYRLFKFTEIESINDIELAPLMIEALLHELNILQVSNNLLYPKDKTHIHAPIFLVSFRNYRETCEI